MIRLMQAGRAVPGRWIRCLAMACALLAAGSPAQAQQAPTEAGVKAAYLYRFLAYVEWPSAGFAAPNAPLVIGFVSADAVADALLDVIAGRSVNGHAIELHRLSNGDSLDGLHVVFVGRAAPQADIVARLRARPVLVVSDGLPGVDGGSMLNFIPVDGRIRFEASTVAAERSGIKLGSRLLALAERVVSR